MNLPNKGYDKNLTYFEHNLDYSDIPNIFIHGVGLNHNMWYPQKKFFRKNQIVFYDLLNHGKSKKNHKELTFKDFVLCLKESRRKLYSAEGSTAKSITAGLLQFKADSRACLISEISSTL